MLKSERAIQKELQKEVLLKGGFKELPAPYNDYMIYTDGTMYSLKRLKFVPLRMFGKFKYPCYSLYINNTRHNVPIHKLVALAFCPLPTGYTIDQVIDAYTTRVLVVDHIDGDVQNYNAKNLRWVTNQQNLNFSNVDRTHQKAVMKGNQNAAGKNTKENRSAKQKAITPGSYIYTYEGHDFLLSQLTTKLGCSKSCITEAFRRNLGLVKEGKLTRRNIKEDK